MIGRGVIVLVALAGCYTSLDVETASRTRPDAGYAGEGLPLLHPERRTGGGHPGLALGLACSPIRCAVCVGDELFLGVESAGALRLDGLCASATDACADSCHPLWDGGRFLVAHGQMLSELHDDGGWASLAVLDAPVWGMVRAAPSLVVASPVPAYERPTGIAISIGRDVMELAPVGVVPIHGPFDPHHIRLLARRSGAVLSWREEALIKSVDITDGGLSSARIVANVGDAVGWGVAESDGTLLLAFGAGDHVAIARMTDGELVGRVGPTEAGLSVGAVHISATASGFFVAWSEGAHVAASRLDASGLPVPGFDEAGIVVAESASASSRFEGIVAAPIGMGDELIAYLAVLGYWGDDRRWRRIDYPDEDLR